MGRERGGGSQGRQWCSWEPLCCGGVLAGGDGGGSAGILPLPLWEEAPHALPFAPLQRCSPGEQGGGRVRVWASTMGGLGDRLCRPGRHDASRPAVPKAVSTPGRCSGPGPGKLRPEQPLPMKIRARSGQQSAVSATVEAELSLLLRVNTATAACSQSTGPPCPRSRTACLPLPRQRPSLEDRIPAARLCSRPLQSPGYKQTK